MSHNKDVASVELNTHVVSVYAQPECCAPCSGDLEASERVAYEFVKDVASHDVVYVEVRYAPHLWSSDVHKPEYAEPGHVTPRQVRAHA